MTPPPSPNDVTNSSVMMRYALINHTVYSCHPAPARSA